MTFKLSSRILRVITKLKFAVTALIKERNVLSAVAELVIEVFDQFERGRIGVELLWELPGLKDEPVPLQRLYRFHGIVKTDAFGSVWKQDCAPNVDKLQLKNDLAIKRQ